MIAVEALEGWRRSLAIAGVVATGLWAGVFFAFSTITMSGLRRIPPLQGLVAMQAINKAADSSPVFLGALFACSAVCVALGASGLSNRDQQWAQYLLIGSVLFLVGTVALTMGYHVPRNNVLAALDASDASATESWRHYAAGWTTWNHVRTVTSLGASVSFALALWTT